MDLWLSNVINWFLDLFIKLTNPGLYAAMEWGKWAQGWADWWNGLWS